MLLALEQAQHTTPDFNHIAFPKKFDHGGLHH
jgi:hypothetical protein